nr:serine/threonine-protein kinase STY8-like [Malus domestica]
MKESSDGFVRADQIDLKSLDEQLERHLNRVLTLEKNKIMRDPETNSNSIHLTTTSTSNSTVTTTATSTSSMTLSIPKRHRQEWEIDPSKLLIKSVIARGTFGTVHRGIYDGQDVAGIPLLPLALHLSFGGPLKVVKFKLLDWGEEGHRTDSEIASLRAAFTQEVAVWHKLDHPNVTKPKVVTLPETVAFLLFGILQLHLSPPE